MVSALVLGAVSPAVADDVAPGCACTTLEESRQDLQQRMLVANEILYDPLDQFADGVKCGAATPNPGDCALDPGEPQCATLFGAQPAYLRERNATFAIFGKGLANGSCPALCLTDPQNPACPAGCLVDPSCPAPTTPLYRGAVYAWGSPSVTDGNCWRTAPSEVTGTVTEVGRCVVCF
ncbi:MAG TPA: hypothetical protein VKA21_12580 [Candidatus Binatia bacterium]|nr:hypothetical protein [Candidatus Binatia bacterium]